MFVSDRIAASKPNAITIMQIKTESRFAICITEQTLWPFQYYFSLPWIASLFLCVCAYHKHGDFYRFCFVVENNKYNEWTNTHTHISEHRLYSCFFLFDLQFQFHTRYEDNHQLINIIRFFRCCCCCYCKRRHISPNAGIQFKRYTMAAVAMVAMHKIGIKSECECDKKGECKISAIAEWKKWISSFDDVDRFRRQHQDTHIHQILWFFYA